MPIRRPIDRRALLALALVALPVRAALAQSDSTALAGAHVRVRLMPPDGVSYAPTRHEGALVRLGTDSVVIRDGRRTRAFPRNHVARIDARERRHSAGHGALRYGVPAAIVGSIGGVLLGTYAGANERCELTPGGRCYGGDLFPPRETGLVIGAMSGLLGAWYGATAGRWGWTRIDGEAPRVGVYHARGGVGIAVSLTGR